MSDRALRIIQRGLEFAGVALLAVAALALIDGSVSSQRALRAFDEARAEGSPAGGVDFSLWSPQRIREYTKSLAAEKRLPLATLEIDKLRLRVPVFEGTDDQILNRGAGWIVGTARPGTPGNIGLAAHRDGFFRGLKDIAMGDALELTTLQERSLYIVDQIEIVTPESVEVLRPRRLPSLTLVTCYPFYFVGDAPQRFIVHASLDRTIPASPSGDPRR